MTVYNRRIRRGRRPNHDSVKHIVNSTAFKIHRRWKSQSSEVKQSASSMCAEQGA